MSDGERDSDPRLPTFGALCHSCGRTGVERGARGEPALLAGAYENAFARAREAGNVRSIAFPAISTGIYGFPKPDAARIALAAMRAHESEYERIVACLFDEESAALYREILAAPPPPR